MTEISSLQYQTALKNNKVMTNKAANAGFEVKNLKVKKKKTQMVASNALGVDFNPALFLQEIQHDIVEDEQAFKDFGDRAFKSLKRLQLAILEGALKEEDLTNLHESIKGKITSSSPQMQKIIREIEVRIAVEIAKIHKNCSE